MKSIKILDCTLRDGGYINNWEFGEKAIKDISQKLANAGIDIIEMGFIKEEIADKNRTVFSSIEDIKEFIQPKNNNILYAAMLDMSHSIPIEKLQVYDGNSVDILRVIFKKNKTNEAFEYCKQIKKIGYKLFVQPVGIDNYSDKELIELILKFNVIKPDAFYLVDSFGLISKKDFSRLLYITDNNLDKNIVLGYHSHNNMQQAYGNAQAMVELNLDRDLIMDVSIYGMGRGAGNLNLEIFANYLNKFYGKTYRIEPILEIIDEHIQKIFIKNFWGYSLPLYLSALHNCHPNYAIYFSEKNTLNTKSIDEILKNMDCESKQIFSRESAEHIYEKYQSNYVEDSFAKQKLKNFLYENEIVILASGSSIVKNEVQIKKYIIHKKAKVIAVNFAPKAYDVDLIFCSNERRIKNISKEYDDKLIITSNIKTKRKIKYKTNYQSLLNSKKNIAHNSSLMLINLLLNLGFKKVSIAGFDGYTMNYQGNYAELELDLIEKNENKLQRNEDIKDYLEVLCNIIDINFITPSLYH